jgi:hypothetical protein
LVVPKVMSFEQQMGVYMYIGAYTIIGKTEKQVTDWRERM